MESGGEAVTKVQRKPKFRVGQVVRSKRSSCEGYDFEGINRIFLEAAKAANEDEIKPLTKKEMVSSPDVDFLLEILERLDQ